MAFASSPGAKELFMHLQSCVCLICGVAVSECALDFFTDPTIGYVIRTRPDMMHLDPADVRQLAPTTALLPTWEPSAPQHAGDWFMVIPNNAVGLAFARGLVETTTSQCQIGDTKLACSTAPEGDIIHGFMSNAYKTHAFASVIARPPNADRFDCFRLDPSYNASCYAFQDALKLQTSADPV